MCTDAARYPVSVDYLNDITPSNYFLWTSGYKDPLTSEQWTTLAATSMEWMLLSRGSSVLGVKGVSGGERTMMSSFALSAAAFGPAQGLEMLQQALPMPTEEERAVVLSRRRGRQRADAHELDGCHWLVTWGLEFT